MRTVSLSPSVLSDCQDSMLMERLVLEHSTLLRIHCLSSFHWQCTDPNTIDLVFVLHGLLNTTLAHEPVQLPAGFVFIKNTNETLKLSCQPDSKLLLLSIPVMVFRMYLLDYFKLAPFKTVVFDSMVDCNSPEKKSIMQLFKQFDEGMSDLDSLISRGLISGLLEGQMLLAIMDSLSWSYEKDIKGKVCELRPKYIKKAIDYLMMNERRKINLQDLAAAAGVGVRTLQTGFQQTYGISPMYYVRRYKLQKVREYLLEYVAQSSSIGDIAAQWGFMHPSSFAKSYYTFFGEYPSETMKQSLSTTGFHKKALPK